MSKVKDLYKKIPELHCKGLCSLSCGPILLQQEELDRIEAVSDIDLVYDEKLICPLLVNKRCSVYQDRPIICRLWGTVKGRRGMECPWGCKPKRWLSDAESRAILDEAREISPVVTLSGDDFATAFSALAAKKKQ